MKQEHDYSGALESMPKEDVHERVIWRWFLKHYSEIRAALTAAKGDGWLPIDGKFDLIETAKKELQWMKDTATDKIDRARIVGYEDCLRLMSGLLKAKPPQDGGDDE